LFNFILIYNKKDVIDLAAAELYGISKEELEQFL